MEDEMGSRHEDVDETERSGSRSAVGPLVGLGLIVAAVGVGLGAKAVVQARRKGSSVRSELPLAGGGDADASSEELPAVLRRAALDVALAATSQAADRLGSQSQTVAGPQRARGR
jgi:hypothetical protein